jgi:hypothetical protein
LESVEISTFGAAFLTCNDLLLLAIHQIHENTPVAVCETTPEKGCSLRIWRFHVIVRNFYISVPWALIDLLMKQLKNFVKELAGILLSIAGKSADS